MDCTDSPFGRSFDHRTDMQSGFGSRFGSGLDYGFDYGFSSGFGMQSGFSSGFSSHFDMQEFYDRWSLVPDPILHLSPSLPEAFLVRSIKDMWFERVEEAAQKIVGQRLLVRESISGGVVVQYLTERTEHGWARHIVAFREGETSPFPLS